MHSLLSLPVTLSVLFVSFVQSFPLKSRSDDPLLDFIVGEIASLNTTYEAYYNLSLLNDLAPTEGKYYITQKDPDPLTRAAELAVIQLGFLYGPPIAGGPYFPTGPIGLARAALDQAEIQADEAPELTNLGIDAAKATADIAQYDGLVTLDDYTKLYDNEWELTLPRGPDPGVLTNYTQDLLFSMERLSDSPYQVYRLPASTSLPFQVSNSIATKVCGMSLHRLLSSGRLFYADYRDQANQTRTTLYASASDAYFCINLKNDDFLPLAIRTNAGAGPIYTPEDNADDWLSAKIMFNTDDFWFAQWNHLANTHEVVQIAYMAAIRTVSPDHPVQAILNRLMYEVFAIQPLAQAVLFDPGAVVDQTFAYTGLSAQAYTTNRYQNQGAGQFQKNYFLTELENRGLINSKFGPALKSFPFYEDGSVIYNAINGFMTSFVNSYYSSNAVVKADSELQAWVTEARNVAKAIDFPSITTRQSLISVLTHFGHLASAAHHTVNTNELLSMSTVLPFHTSALYRAPPTTKPANGTGINPVEYLPPFAKALEELTVAAIFARPLLVNTNRSLLHMFDDPQMLQKMNPQTQTAANTFFKKMTAFGNVVGSRTFDAQGLSQGMPFVWQALDPNIAPYSITT